MGNDLSDDAAFEPVYDKESTCFICKPPCIVRIASAVRMAV